MPKSYQALNFIAQQKTEVTDILTLEAALEIIVNGASFSVVMNTPGNEIDLALGLLFSEGIIDTNSKMISYRIEDIAQTFSHKIYIVVEGLIKEIDSNERALVSNASCGVCGKRSINDLQYYSDYITDNSKVSIEQLSEMFEVMAAKQKEFKLSGGSHAATICDKKGNLLVIREDIGRHNAVDKAIGHLLQNNLLGEIHCLLVSGRVSYEIITKAKMAMIPIVAAISAPSSLAVDLSKESGITLLAFCRGEKATCYSHGHRLISNK